jgi:hypothetical protein
MTSKQYSAPLAILLTLAALPAGAELDRSPTWMAVRHRPLCVALPAIVSRAGAGQ